MVSHDVTAAYAQAADGLAQLEANGHNHDDWGWEEELELGMDAQADLASDAAPFYGDDEPARRSTSADITDYQRLPSVQITGYNRAPSEEITANTRPPPPPDMVATADELGAWEQEVVQQSIHPLGLFPPVAHICADSVDAAANAVLAMLQHSLSDPATRNPAFQLPDGVQICSQAVKVASFTDISCTIQV